MDIVQGVKDHPVPALLAAGAAATIGCCGPVGTLGVLLSGEPDPTEMCAPSAPTEELTRVEAGDTLLGLVAEHGGSINSALDLSEGYTYTLEGPNPADDIYPANSPKHGGWYSVDGDGICYYEKTRGEDPSLVFVGFDDPDVDLDELRAE